MLIGVSNPRINYNYFKDNNSDEIFAGGAIYATTEPEEWSFDNPTVFSTRCDEVLTFDFTNNYFEGNSATTGSAQTTSTNFCRDR